MLFWGCISSLDDGLMTSTFADDLSYYGDVVFYLWYLLCDISFTVSNSHNLSKVFRCSFLVTTKNVKFLWSCSMRNMTGMAS